MEEIEVPLEGVQENLNEKAEQARERWMEKVALSSALLAVCAAVAALLAGHHSNEAMIDQIRASDQWAYYQAKGIKSAVLESRTSLTTKDEEKIASYKTEQEEIKTQAKEKEESSEHHLKVHSTLAKSVTLFQVAIAIGAIAVLVRNRRFWYFSLGFGLLGTLLFCIGFFYV